MIDRRAALLILAALRETFSGKSHFAQRRQDPQSRKADPDN
jgi:hypothetical protein